MSNKIPMSTDRFVGLGKDGGIEVLNANGKTHLHLCDFVVDATGSKREVIKKVNELVPGAFTIAPLADNPLKKHLMAYVKIDAVHHSTLKFPENPSPLEKVNTIGMLQEKFGWGNFNEPAFTFFKVKGDKVCIYCEIPDDLTPELTDDWLKALIAHRTGRSDVTFTKLEASRKYAHKPRFLTLEVNPQHVKECVYYNRKQIDSLIMPIGDASAEGDFHLGIGVEYGIEKVDAFMKCIEIENGKIVKFDIERYKYFCAAIVDRQQDELIVYYAKQKYKLDQSPDDVIKLSQQALGMLSAEDIKIDKIKQVSRRAYIQVAQDLYNRGLVDYRNDSLISATTLIIKSLEMLQDGQNPLKEVIETTLLDIAKELKSRATTFYQEKKFSEAAFHYQESLDVYLKAFKNSYLDEVTKIYSNILLTAKKNDLPINKLIEIANTAFNSIPANMPDREKIKSKILFNKADAILDEVLKINPQNMFGKSIAIKYLNEVNGILPKLQNKFIDDNTYKAISEKFESVAKKHDYKPVMVTILPKMEKK